MMKEVSEKLSGRIVTFSEVEEILLNVDCTMNNWPLCYQGEDIEHQVIAPYALLQGNPAVMLEEDLGKMPSECKILLKSKRHFRKWWMNRYLHALEE